MRRQTCLALAILSVLALACHGKPARVSGTGFSFPVPAGWSAQTHEGVAGMLVQDQRTGVDYFLGSVDVVPLGAAAKSVDLTKLEVCQAAAAQEAQQEDLQVDAVVIADTPLGKLCQIDAKGKDPKQAARFYVVKTAKGIWGVTCNHDPRDTAVLQVCSEILAGWRDQ